MITSEYSQLIDKNGEKINECEKCTIERCDIFDFMAQHVGLSILHPGGLQATSELAEKCSITEATKVIDNACGKGTTAIYLAKRYGCPVTGIDISENLIAEARHLAQRNKVTDKVNFQIADALNLPFSDNEFDVAFSQAMLVLVDDQKKAIQEALRVIKHGGKAGWIELSWKKEPARDFLAKVSNEICAYCMANVHTFEGWENLFSQAGFRKVEVMCYSMEFQGITGMRRDEGFVNSWRVMFRYLTNRRIRNRMNSLNRFFKAHPEYFGYGIYIGTK